MILFSYLCKVLCFSLTKFIEKQEISLGHFLVLMFFFPFGKMKFLPLSDTHQSWNLGIWLLRPLFNLNFITICKLFLVLFLNASLTAIWHEFLSVSGEFKVPYLPCLTHMQYKAAPSGEIQSFGEHFVLKGAVKFSMKQTEWWISGAPWSFSVTSLLAWVFVSHVLLQRKELRNIAWKQLRLLLLILK